jgi:trans-2,3-dihydro-3-hydroxyanthranilate isomerase
VAARATPCSSRSTAIEPLGNLHPYTVLDVFTDRRLAGNQLAVVHDADGVDDETMGALARETKLSETTFVQRPSATGADYRNRIWTVAGEIPFAGHPSLGTAVAVAQIRGHDEARYVQETGAGLQPIELRRLEGGVWRASMLQEPAQFGAQVSATHVMAAIGLVPGEAHRELVPQVISTGLPTLVALVHREEALADVQPDFDLIGTLLSNCGAPNLYVAWFDGDSHARARMFTEAVAGGEDPATGSAAGPLGAYLAYLRRSDRLEISQGVEMGRPSRLMAAMEGDRVRVGGDVVTVIEGTVSL